MRKELWHFFKLAWRHALNFKSRASRKELGYYLLAVMLVPLLSLIVRRGHDNHISGYLTLFVIGIFITLPIISFKNFQPAVITLQSIVFVALLYIITKDNKLNLK